MSDSSTREALDDARDRIQQGDIEGAWHLLTPLHAQLDRDRGVAEAWLSLLRIAPGHPDVVRDVGAILERWPDDPQLVLPACDALIKTAELRPIDEPPSRHGPEQLAARAALRCQDLMRTRAEVDPDTHAYLLLNIANARRLARQMDAALESFHRVLQMHPERGWWWFNLGLLHKARGDWHEALQANERARERLGNEKPVLWNLAIAATALGDGARACEAWRSLGLNAEVAESGMPYVEDLPPLQVRVASLGTGRGQTGTVPDRAVGFEVVSVAPLSPCHGVVQTPTYRQASVDYGDVVLWDGAPARFVQEGDTRVPRFPLLAVLRRGDEHRFAFVARERDSGAVRRMDDILPMEARVFVHRERVERAHSPAVHVPAGGSEPPGDLVYGKMIIPGHVDLRRFRQVFEQLMSAHPEVDLCVPGLLEAVGDTQAAGKAHQLWRGLERTAEKAAS